MNVPVSEDFQNLLDRVRQFVQNTLEPISLQVEADAEIPETIVDQIRALGLFGMPVPKAFGGLELTTMEEIRIYEEITQTNACYRSRIGTSNGIGSMGIVYDGTDEQKQHYLPRIASGQWTTSFALTEPDAGSDASHIRMSAVLDGDAWVLNGNKVFITNADAAQLFTVIAVTDEEKGTRGGVTAFIVERGVPGFSIGPGDVKMGLKGSHTHELVFKDCRIPRENVIGGMEKVGQGFKTAMQVLDKGRLSMGACALGASQKMMELCIDRVREKIAAGTPKDQLQTVQFALADMATQIFAARQMLYHAAWLKDQGRGVTREASMVKVFCTEMASRIADSALEIFEADGCLTRNRIEMFLRDVRLYRIYEGTSEIQRIIISRDLLKNQNPEHRGRTATAGMPD
ncbi:acyl-CoA dehydrogenase family protein [Desulfosarcina sp. OttesenSCG-928-A07]|nr:acyl-CoA dehydrogenase family protein [Desulfosarcina sp. OttesenSCG-928-G17]MDL2329252.1 acyl-CoA dehydrogenase family protein [Desulfosarcina sp. OttesenSCG-928-A07]